MKDDWSSLTTFEQAKWIEKAQFLINRGYSKLELYKLAETIYNKKKEYEEN